MSEQTINIAIAGSTERTVECASALLNDNRFQIEWILTPDLKPIGRKQELKKNPVHAFAESNQITRVLIKNKIDTVIQKEILSQKPIHLLLVVDFGYIIPDWLLSVPSHAPVNIHPSALPRWRGSSPGQFVLLYGEKTSAVSVIVMNSTLDQGDIISQIPFEVPPSWDQFRYYQESFGLISHQLPDILSNFSTGALQPQAQPATSPTPTAVRLSRENGFIPWEVLELAMKGENAKTDTLSQVLQNAAGHHPSVASLIKAASKAFYPWPGIWTEVHTDKGKKRMKILSCSVSPENSDILQLETVPLEGKASSAWNQVKSQLIS